MYGPNLENDSKLETISCFVAKQIAFDDGKLIGVVNPIWFCLVCAHCNLCFLLYCPPHQTGIGLPCFYPCMLML